MLIKGRFAYQCGPSASSLGCPADLEVGGRDLPPGGVREPDRFESTKGNFMSSNGSFIPRQKRAATDYGAVVHGVISAANYDPAAVGLTDADVTELGDAVAANQAALARVDSLKVELMGATKALSGRKGTHQRMIAKLRQIGNKARSSNASASQLMKFRVRRKKLRGTRRNPPDDAPEFSMDYATPGGIVIRFREMGSASPRARAANTTGVQVAVVDAAQPVTSGEADRVPIKTVSRSPSNLATKGWPAKVRLYARWVTQRGETSAWSDAVPVTVL